MQCRCRTGVVLRCCRNIVWPWPRSPVLKVAAVKTTRLNPRASALVCESRGRAEYGKPKSNEKELSRTKLVATCRASLARSEENSTHRWVNCRWVNCAYAQ